MKRKLSFTLLLFISAIYGYAQLAGGKCLSNLNVPSYINCGNNAAFNLSGEFTLEAWINQYTFGADRKLIGKTNTSFNSGFVFGLEDGIYTEIWQPARTELKAGTLPTFVSWVHVAITFKPGNELKGYINGELVGSTAVASSNIASNTEDLIIGIAPWDFGALMFLGQMDEIRFWQVEKTATEIQANMHKELTGSETDLIAHYNLNAGSGSTAANSTSVSGLNGSITGSGWEDSYAVIGSSTMQSLNDVKGLWLGMTNDPVADLRVVNTSNGLSVVTAVDSIDYIVFGHDGATGTTSADLPSAATNASYERAARTWLIEETVTDTAFSSQLIFDLTDAAGGGAQLDGSQVVANYALFKRDNTTGDFIAVQAATTVNAGKVIFDDVELNTGYYTLGVGTSSLFGVDGLNEVLVSHVKVVPNPSSGIFNIELDKAIDLNNSMLVITNLLGSKVYESNVNDRNIRIDLGSVEKGVYNLTIVSSNQTIQKVVIVE